MSINWPIINNYEQSVLLETQPCKSNLLIVIYHFFNKIFIAYFFVHFFKMIKETVKQFPVIPQEFQINPSAENIRNLRREMAQDILLAAGYCSNQYIIAF